MFFFPKFKDWNQDLTTAAIADLKHGDGCTLPNYTDTIKIFSNSESMAYKLAESKHLSGAARNPMAPFFVLEENLDGGGSLRKYLNEGLDLHFLQDNSFYWRSTGSILSPVGLLFIPLSTPHISPQNITFMHHSYMWYPRFFIHISVGLKA